MRAADWLVDLGPGRRAARRRARRRGHAGGGVRHPGLAHGATTSRAAGRFAVPATRRRRQRHAARRAGRARAQPARTWTSRFRSARSRASPASRVRARARSVNDILLAALARHLGLESASRRARIARSQASEHIDKVVAIDQSPIGRTPRSNPATYTGAFTLIRDLFAQLPEAKVRGYGPGRFSFNVKGGRCETCEGDGCAAHRDALPARRVREVRRLPRPPLQPRHARGAVPRPLHRRRARDDRGGGPRVPRGRARPPEKTRDAARRRASAIFTSVSPQRRCRAARRSA